LEGIAGAAVVVVAALGQLLLVPMGRKGAAAHAEANVAPWSMATQNHIPATTIAEIRKVLEREAQGRRCMVECVCDDNNNTGYIGNIKKSTRTSQTSNS
jgi:hypothetical protein